MKVVAIIGLLFFVYATARVYTSWQYRDRLNVTIWFIILSSIGGVCIGLLGRYSWIAILGLLVAGLAGLIVVARKGR
jgi:hypothetical protein